LGISQKKKLRPLKSALSHLMGRSSIDGDLANLISDQQEIKLYGHIHVSEHGFCAFRAGGFDHRRGDFGSERLKSVVPEKRVVLLQVGSAAPNADARGFFNKLSHFFDSFYLLCRRIFSIDLLGERNRFRSRSVFSLVSMLAKTRPILLHNFCAPNQESWNFAFSSNFFRHSEYFSL
jgi:hypothetical protein